MNDLFEKPPAIEELWKMVKELQEVVYGRADKPGRTAPSLQVPETLAKAWTAWDAYRRTGKRWTADAKARSLRDLVEHSGGRADWAEAIVDRSIKSGWVGLFALPPENRPKEAPKTGIVQLRRPETKEEAHANWLKQQEALR